MRERNSPWPEEILSPEPGKERAVLSKSLIILITFVSAGLSTAAVVHAQKEGSTGYCCCGDGMREGSGSMEGMAGMAKEKGQQPPPEGGKKIGEEFVCPVDGMRKMATSWEEPA
jgi:hypothetical protein